MYFFGILEDYSFLPLDKAESLCSTFMLYRSLGMTLGEGDYFLGGRKIDLLFFLLLELRQEDIRKSFGKCVMK